MRFIPYLSAAINIALLAHLEPRNRYGQVITFSRKRPKGKPEKWLSIWTVDQTVFVNQRRKNGVVSSKKIPDVKSLIGCLEKW